jgi:lipid-A-disaccharide synthase
VDHLLVVFPFEEPLFRSAGIDAVFVGHPLLDSHAERTEPRALRDELGIGSASPILALLPGSRPQEVSRILPVLVSGVGPLASRGVRAVASRAPGLSAGLFRVAEEAGIPVWTRDAVSLVDACRAALVASGTATLEAGLLRRPLAVVYRTHPMNWQLARRLVRLRTVGLVNIAAGGDRVPELLQGNLAPERVREVAERLLFDPRERAEQEAYLAPLRERLGGVGGAAERAAEVVARILEKRAA